VGGLRSLGLLLSAAVLLCLPAAAQTYSTHVPPGSRVEALVSHTADWDVSITFDPEACEVYCEYRRKATGLHLFLQPVTELRIYTDGADNPQVILVDPAGVQVPVIVRSASDVPELACVEGKGLANSAQPACELVAAPPARVRPLTLTPAIDRSIRLALRI
jgi:hypothetical protein